MGPRIWLQCLEGIIGIHRSTWELSITRGVLPLQSSCFNLLCTQTCGCKAKGMQGSTECEVGRQHA